MQYSGTSGLDGVTMKKHASASETLDRLLEEAGDAAAELTNLKREKLLTLLCELRGDTDTTHGDARTGESAPASEPPASETGTPVCPGRPR